MEEQKNKRKAIILTIVAVLTLIGLVIGATFAYFQAQVGTGAKTDVTVKAGTTDDLSFSLKDLNATKEKVSDNDSTTPIVIEPNQTNFASGSDSIADGVTGTATLIAGDDDYKTEDGEFTYNVYLNITKNELQYSSYIKKEPDETPENVLSFKDEAKKAEADLNEYDPRPELYLTIKQNGEEVTDGVTINDNALNYVSDVFTEDDTQLGGFDITETKGLIKISVPTDIKVENGSADSHTTTDTWEITVTFMNLDTDQYLNTGKSVVGEVIIQNGEYVTQDIKTLNKLLVDANKEEATTLYYHNAELEGGAQDDSYRYAGEDYRIANNYKDEYRQIKDDLIKKSCNGQDINIDEYDENCNDEEYNDISKYYLIYKGKGTLYDTYNDACKQAIKDNYLEEYIKNYVCLDSRTTGECESDEDLYRIIGLFKNNQDEYEMKLIKAQGATTTELGDSALATGGAYDGLYSSSYSSHQYSGQQSYYKGTNWETLGSYYWNSTRGTSYSANNVNMWAESNLNKVNLNQFFYNYITTRATYLQNHITEHTWVTGGTANIYGAKEVYNSELGENKVTVDDNLCYTPGNARVRRKCTQEDIEYTDHIGLFYISDYMYGASPASWTKPVGGYSSAASNDWLYSGMYEWSISRYMSGGNLARRVDFLGNAEDGYPIDENYGVRPSFYLTSNAKIKEGEGSKTKPYRITFE